MTARAWPVFAMSLAFGVALLSSATASLRRVVEKARSSYIQELSAMFKKFSNFTNNLRAITVFACLIAIASISLADGGHKDNDAASRPGVIFSTSLPDVPGKQLTVVELEFDPKIKRPSFGHRHPGSVYIYVTSGSVRFGIEGEPVQLLHAGDSFFEPAGALHTVAENASDTETASAIAVMIVPDGAPLVTQD